MRNLKRVLSLALALVMVLGMMVITTSAAKFTDADEITYTEAVDVISAIGVITGYKAADGTFYFDGDKLLSRAEGAALVCYLMMGKEAADKLVGSGNFTDVPADHWAAGEIDYCYNLGFIAGNGNGTFNPDGPLTSIGFGRMLLGALGYDGGIEGYTGPNWSTAISADMVDIGLDVNGVALDAQLTREQAAQMALQAMECTMVKYTNKGTSITIEGVDVVVGASAAEAIPASYKDSYVADVEDDTLQLVEKYFPTVSKIATTDAMARPAHEWMVKNDAVGLYADEADYTAFVTAKNFNLDKVVENISKRFDMDDADIYVNGDKNNTYTGARGDIVEVYMDSYNATKVDTIVVTHKTVVTCGAVTTVTANDVTYVEVTNVTPGALTSDMVEGYEGLKPGTVVMYYVDADDVYHIEVAESFNGTMTASIDANGNASVTDPNAFVIGGETYYASKQTNSILETALVGFKSDATATYWVDNDGNIIAAAGAEDPVELLMVLKNDTYQAGNIFTGSTLQSQVVFINAKPATEIIAIAEVDGTKTALGAEPIALDDDGTDTTFADNENLPSIVLYDYSVNKDGSYNLVEQTTGVVSAGGQKLVTGIPSVFQTSYTEKAVTDSTTVYLLRDIYTRDGGTYADTYTAYVGYKNVPSLNVKSYGAEIYSERGVAKYVVINDYTLTSSPAADDVYVLSSEVTANWNAQRQVENFTVSAIVDGVKTTIQIANGAQVEDNTGATASLNTLTNPIKDHTLYIVTEYDEDGYISAMAEAVSSASGAGKYYWVGMVGSEAAKNDKLVLGVAQGTNPETYKDTSFAYAEDAVVYTISARGDIVTTGDITSLGTDSNDKISVVVKGNVYGTAANNTIVEMYVYKQNPAAPGTPTGEAYVADVTTLDKDFFGANYNSAVIKSLDDGAYQFTTIPTLTPTIQHTTNAADILFLKFTSKAASSATTLEIADEDGNVIYTETVSNSWAADTDHFFYVQVLGDTVYNEGTTLNTALAEGTYNYNIVDAASNILLVGTFTIAE